MKNILLFILLFQFSAHAQSEIFANLLQKHVDKFGNVDYKNFKKDEANLDTYLNYLNTNSPNNTWTTNKQKAFWINAYNANTIKLILKNYPVKSITNIKGKAKNPWNIPFIKINNKILTLDDIEHQILRKNFSDPRIHAAVNCASISCPKLSNIAFTEQNIESELERLIKNFINNPDLNKLDKKSTVHISEIFNWFKKDFIKNGSIIDYINKYAIVKVSNDATIHYLPYNWNLNEK